MVGFDPGEVFDVLTSRREVLVSLSEGGKKPADLTTELGVSRSTIDRSIRELEGVGFVDVVDGVAHTTLSGRMALSTYNRFVAQLDDIGEAASALESLPPDAPFDSVMLDGCDVVVASDSDGEQPLERLTSLLEDAVSVRGCVVAALPSQVEVYYRRIVDDDVSAELVATEDVVERLVTAYRPQLVELCATDSFSLRSIASLPYSLLVVERPTGPVAIVETYSSRTLVGVVSNDRPDAVAWARSQIDRWAAASTPLPFSTAREE
ncbi:ArsR family transcriptional regulator [Haloferax sp. MBLA0076]|uniref:ArsR family transcriptional regulator n=1 Tax=Haloferax litoreum TaxID=2666140 RepID=A0A6A8GH02_9EURY|nr:MULTISPECIES: ArsR family transcriptional regulator [Haloferax]KAB1194089.1 ArsR family transcriptional regulator [Haloferax sp. CBA1148]MRX22644.1 ArsR family transcriptional regulator [Haloferax litoreum]